MMNPGKANMIREVRMEQRSPARMELTTLFCLPMLNSRGLSTSLIIMVEDPPFQEGADHDSLLDIDPSRTRDPGTPQMRLLDGSVQLVDHRIFMNTQNMYPVPQSRDRTRWWYPSSRYLK